MKSLRFIVSSIISLCSLVINPVISICSDYDINYSTSLDNITTCMTQNCGFCYDSLTCELGDIFKPFNKSCNNWYYDLNIDINTTELLDCSNKKWKINNGLISAITYIPPTPIVDISYTIDNKFKFNIKMHYLGEKSTYIVDFEKYTDDRHIKYPGKCENRVYSDKYHNMTDNELWYSPPNTNIHSLYDNTFYTYQSANGWILNDNNDCVFIRYINTYSQKDLLNNCNKFNTSYQLIKGYSLQNTDNLILASVIFLLAFNDVKLVNNLTLSSVIFLL